MPKGFFNSQTTQFQKPENRNKVKTQPSCGICKLHKQCNSPKMKVSGQGGKGILIVGEAPGETEDEIGRQFVGKAGQRLRNTLALFDINMENDCWLINSINCRPPKNRTPTHAEIEYCRPIPMKAIKDLEPEVIILCGGTAVSSVIGNRWKKNLKGITRWRGWTIPDRDLNAWICPIFHPSYVERMDNVPVIEKIFTDDLARAINTDRQIPEFKDEKQFVQIMKSETEIKSYLADLIKRRPMTAFDYETTGLKPHARVQEIVTMAISEHREHAVSFPMTNGIQNAVREYLVNGRLKKIAANMKFEESWSRGFLGVEVEGWWFDTLLGARILDNRSDISSLKFQVYVNFGLVDYDSQVEGFLKAGEKGAHGLNRIKEIKIDDLLMYGGLDALFERWLADEQEREIAR